MLRSDRQDRASRPKTPLLIRLLLVILVAHVAFAIYLEFASGLQEWIERTVLERSPEQPSFLHLIPILAVVLLYVPSLPLGLWVAIYLERRLAGKTTCWRCGFPKKPPSRCFGCGRFDLRWLKWSGAVFSLAMLVAFLVSGFAAICLDYSVWQLLLTEGVLAVSLRTFMSFSNHYGFQGWQVVDLPYGTRFLPAIIERT